MIPIHSADGRSLGFRPLEAAEGLIASGHVKPAYGRRGCLKAIFLPQEDGGNPIELQARPGTRYSFLQDLNGGQCWTLRRVDGRDEDGNLVSLRGDFLRVLAGCLVP